MNDKIIFINGFTKDETIKIMRAVKGAVENPSDAAFCMGTDANREWIVKDLIREVREEHEYLMENPPAVSPQG
jgi:hypothetical protein